MALFHVRLSDHQATLQPNVALNSDTIFFVMQMRLTFSSFPVSVPPPLLASTSECIWPALRSWDRLPRVRPSNSEVCQIFPTNISRFLRTSLFRLRMLRHDTAAALLHTMCSPVLVSKPNQQPSNQFMCCLKNFCPPNAAIC